MVSYELELEVFGRSEIEMGKVDRTEENPDGELLASLRGVVLFSDLMR